MTIAYFNKKLSEAINNVKCYVKNRLTSRDYKYIVMKVATNPVLAVDVIDNTITPLTGVNVTDVSSNACGDYGIEISFDGYAYADFSNLYILSYPQKQSNFYSLFVCTIDDKINLSIKSPNSSSGFFLEATYLEIRLY